MLFLGKRALWSGLGHEGTARMFGGRRASITIAQVVSVLSSSRGAGVAALISRTFRLRSWTLTSCSTRWKRVKKRRTIRRTLHPSGRLRGLLRGRLPSLRCWRSVSDRSSAGLLGVLRFCGLSSEPRAPLRGLRGGAKRSCRALTPRECLSRIHPSLIARLNFKPRAGFRSP